jgi:arylsulfatase A-like enzyme
MRALAAAALAAAACAAPRVRSLSPSLGADRYRGSKPNILILFTDDHGWGDVGHNNPATTETVAIDALAASGITFKDMHTFPLCTPSRAQLLTGRVSTRTGVTQNFGVNSLYGLPRSEHTIAELLKPAGYDAVQLGKWQSVAAPPPSAPRASARPRAPASAPAPRLALPPHRPPARAQPRDAPRLPPHLPRL